MEEKSVKAMVMEQIEILLEGASGSISSETPLVGSSSALDSMKLVQLCIILEDIASEMGFEFDWTSEAAMSKSRGMFRSAGALSDEFLRQMHEKI
jgi:acyl carrier protein